MSYPKLTEFSACPIKGSCIYKSIQCNEEVCCSWLEFENKIREVKGDV